ncbi:hypothetical protein FACS1894206_05820 [Deltaproteobacteria bacterium]|nr:hypothetical protein FACS1894206_05820 [Deltaproteobacteria bacterium]
MQSNGNTHLNSLTERIKAKTERDTQEIETLTRQQFENLSRSLGASSKNALSATESVILKNISELERNISSKCQILSWAFGKKCLQAATLTACIIMAAALTGWGLVSLFRYQITGLRQEVTALSERKESLEAQSSALWRTFRGLQPYQADGKDYLLTPEGYVIWEAGAVGNQTAWIIVRRK